MALYDFPKLPIYIDDFRKYSLAKIDVLVNTVLLDARWMKAPFTEEEGAEPYIELIPKSLFAECEEQGWVYSEKTGEHLNPLLLCPSENIKDALELRQFLADNFNHYIDLFCQRKSGAVSAPCAVISKGLRPPTTSWPVMPFSLDGVSVYCITEPLAITVAALAIVEAVTTSMVHVACGMPANTLIGSPNAPFPEDW